MNESYFRRYIENSILSIESLLRSEVMINEVASAMISSLRQGGKVLWFGNGGSAADSLHLSAELVGKFMIDRKPLPSLSLSSNPSIITAIGNDYGFESVFSRQIRALGNPGDVAVGISTSGRSPNVIHGLKAAKCLNLTTVAITGNDPSLLVDCSDFVISVDSKLTCHIQEAHITVGQALCGFIEAEFS